MLDALASAEIAKAEPRDNDGAGDDQDDADLAPSGELFLEHDHRHDRGGERQHALRERARVRPRRESKPRTAGERVGSAAADHDGSEARPAELVECPAAAHHHRTMTIPATAKRSAI